MRHPLALPRSAPPLYPIRSLRTASGRGPGRDSSDNGSAVPTATADFDQVMLRQCRAATGLTAAGRTRGDAVRETHEPDEAVNAWAGNHRAGSLRGSALPAHCAPEPTLAEDATSSQMSLGQGVSLQMPGQTMAMPLASQPPAPWSAGHEESGASTVSESAADEIEAAETKPPALPDQYHPLFKPNLMASGAGHVVAPGSPQLPRKPPKKHTIHDGDTLESLAVRYLGRRRRAAEILEGNRDVLKDPQLLPIGVVITIPPADEKSGPADAAAAPEASPLVPLPSDGFRRGR